LEAHLFRSIVISTKHEIGTGLTSALEATGHVNIARKMDGYPEGADLLRSVRANASEVVFVDFAEVDKALSVVKLLEARAAQVQIVAFDEHADPDVLRQSMRAGVREFLISPFPRQAVMDTLSNIKEMLVKKPVVHESTNQVFSFLPSKAGVGASTIAANVCAAMGRLPDTRVLLSDFDLSSGMLRFMLKLTNDNCVPDAIERLKDMDENLWPQLVTTIKGVDVLHAGRLNPNLRIDPTHIGQLVEFMRRMYGVLCFDHSGNLERYSLELMQESKRIILVCTAEIPSLHLAREKMAFLKDLGLSGRVSVVLNRMHKKPLFAKDQVEDVLGVPVVRVFPNDYHAVNHSVQEGKLIEPSGELGRSFAEFAAQLMDQPASKPEPAKHRFLEMFRTASPLVSPVRE
jgi:pilus assembly protein CpaE